MAPISKRDARRLPTRQWAHPYDRKVDGPTNEHSTDRSPHAIGGAYGIGWTEFFQCHRNGQVYTVHCSDGVRKGKLAHSSRDYNWMSEMRRRIIARTLSQPKGPIVLSSREWTLMAHSNFVGWLDALPRESEDDPIQTVGDTNRHLTEGQIGTISNVPVIVDPKAKDTLPAVGDFRGAGVEELFSRTRVPRSADRHPTSTSQFGGVFAAAFQKAGIGT